MEECCTVCADPLQFCAFGPCGHDTICSKCVTRMRLMQGSRSCVICKSPAEYVFVTRYMDEHTKKIPAQAWDDLPVRVWYPLHCVPALVLHGAHVAERRSQGPQDRRHAPSRTCCTQEYIFTNTVFPPLRSCGHITQLPHS